MIARMMMDNEYVHINHEFENIYCLQVLLSSKNLSSKNPNIW